MKQLVFNVMASLSFLLCLAMAGLWVRSYWKCDKLKFVIPAYILGDSTTYCMFSDYGSAGVLYSKRIVTMPGFTEDSGFAIDSNNAHDGNAKALNTRGGWCHLGLGYANTTRMPGARSKFHAVLIPHWLLLLLFAILPMVRFIRFRGFRHRVQNGLCLNCGYDLRASEDRCPECGTPIPADVKRMPLE